MKELVKEKFDVDKFIEEVLGKEPRGLKQRKVRVDLGLMGENVITVDGQAVSLPKGVNRVTARTVKEIAGRYRGLILVRESGNGRAARLDDRGVIDLKKENKFRTQEPAGKFQTIPRLGLD